LTSIKKPAIMNPCHVMECILWMKSKALKLKRSGQRKEDFLWKFPIKIVSLVDGETQQMLPHWWGLVWNYGVRIFTFPGHFYWLPLKNRRLWIRAMWRNASYEWNQRH
jgi:hypothetical protein